MAGSGPGTKRAASPSTCCKPGPMVPTFLAEEASSSDLRGPLSMQSGGHQIISSDRDLCHRASFFVAGVGIVDCSLQHLSLHSHMLRGVCYFKVCRSGVNPIPEPSGRHAASRQKELTCYSRLAYFWQSLESLRHCYRNQTTLLR